MAPAFGLVEAKGLLPHFMDAVTKVREPRLNLILKADLDLRCQMADKWSNIIANGNSGDSATIDVSAWLGKATLDACVVFVVFGVRGPWTDRGPISHKDRCCSFRLRLRCLG